MVGATSSNDTTRSEVGGVAGMGGDVRREWTPTPYHSPQPPSLLAAWIALLLVVIALLLVVIALLLVFAPAVSAADPIAGKAIAWPPSWLRTLEDVRPCLSALPNSPFPLPQQNSQRPPIVGLLKLSEAGGAHGQAGDVIKKSVLNPLTANFAPPTVATNGAIGGLLFGAQLPEAARGFLVINRMSADGHPTDVDIIRDEVRRGVASQWRDRETPTLNVVALGSGDYVAAIDAKRKPMPRLIAEAMTVYGASTSTAHWQVHAANCAVSFRPAVYDRLKSEGRLCDAICECAIGGVTDATGRRMIGGACPRIDDLDGPTQVTIAAAGSKRANAYDSNPQATPFDVWFSANGTGLDLKSARAGWDARGNQNP